MRARVLLALVVGSFVSGFGCEGTPKTRDGRVLFQAICARCHAPDGTGDPIERARLGVPNMTDPRWQDDRSDADIRRTIVEGSKSKKMPAFGKSAFDDDQLTALAAYVRTLRRRRSPRSRVDPPRRGGRRRAPPGRPGGRGPRPRGRGPASGGRGGRP